MNVFDISRVFCELKYEYGDFDYHEYIQSAAWKEKAERIKHQRGYRCQLCGVSGYIRPLHAHHNTYERLGNEFEIDLTVLCGECHEIFHKNGGKPGAAPKLSKDEFLKVLRSNGITYTNDDPWRNYEKGKAIIQHMLNGWNTKLYDYYNGINIEVLNAALENEMRTCFDNARTSGNWDAYDSEVDWREAHDYWEGYQPKPNHLYRIPHGV